MRRCWPLLLALAACAEPVRPPGGGPREPPKPPVTEAGPAPVASQPDTRPPRLTLTSPPEGLRTGVDHVWLRGRVDDASPWVDVVVEARSGARRALRLARGEALGERVALEPGVTTLWLTLTDAAGNRARVTRTVTRQAGFFGLPVVAARVVFVIDTSGSMLLADRPEGFALDGAALEAADPRDPAIRALQRLERAKAELSAAIHGLDPGQRFNVLAFSDETRAWRREPVPATEEEKASALAFVAELRASGLTRTEAALLAALDQPGVEAVYLLSDGAPANEPVGDGAQVQAWIASCLAAVRARLEARPVRLHTLGMDGPGVWLKRLGPAPQAAPPAAHLAMFRRFLEELARLGAGSFKSL